MKQVKQEDSQLHTPQQITQSVFKTFFTNTRCNISNEMRAFIFKLLNPQQGITHMTNDSNKTLVITTRLYSAIDDGWNSIDFHKRCDSKGRTVSLFQIDEGDCIGGYTTQHWEQSCKFKEDSSSFLFNLTRSRHFPSNNSIKGIFCYSDLGPYFYGNGKKIELATY